MKVLALFPTGVLAKLTLFPTGVVVGMGLLSRNYLFVCFFPRSSIPPPSHVLVSFSLTTLSKHHVCTFFYLSCFFLYNSGDRSHISLIDVRMNYKEYKWGKLRYNNIFLFLNTAICEIFIFLTYKKNKMFIAKIYSSFQVQLITHPPPG